MKPQTNGIGSDKDLHNIASLAGHYERGVAVVGQNVQDEIAEAALGEEEMYVSKEGELVLPCKFMGLKSATKSGKMDSYPPSQ